MKTDKTLHAIIIQDSLNEAENIASILRNAGIAVRMSYPEDPDDLKDMLQQQNAQLVFCSITSTDPLLDQVIRWINDFELNLPVIATHDEDDPELRVEALQSGARDLVIPSDPQHLQLVTIREMEYQKIKSEMDGNLKNLRESERRCHALLDTSRDAVTYVHEGMHIYANPVYLDTFGFASLDDIEGTPIMDMVTDQDHDNLKKFLRQYSQGEQNTRELEVSGVRPDNTNFNAVMEFSPASYDGEPCTQIIIRDQSINKELEKKLKFLSKQDMLTGLYNRQYFIDELSKAVKRANKKGEGSAIFFIEPDNIKLIKETTGIGGVDHVLSDIANKLREIFIGEVTLSRFGDTTFAILVASDDEHELMGLSEKTRSAVESHITDYDGQSITCTVSIGISQINNTTRTAHDVISRADLACELAHEEGGNRSHLHNPVADEQASKDREEQWSQVLEDAISNGRFKLVYQPIASLHGESQEKYEVLLRMQDAEGNDVPTGKFIPAAEENGMIMSIDRWVISHAIETLSQRRRSGKDTVFFIKLSGQSVQDDTLLPWLVELLKKVRLAGKSLIFELHEATANAILKDAKHFFEGLQSIQCGFCLEHFGTGANSVQLFKHLPADFIKIDGSFMRNLASNKENQGMVKSITEVTQSMGKSSIAEFVEDASSLAILWQCGVNYIQGNFLQQPDEMMNYDFEGDEDEEA